MSSLVTRSAWRSGRSFRATVIGIGAGLQLMAWVELALGWIDMDRCAAMLSDGVTVIVGGVIVTAYRMVSVHLTWPRRSQRMRRNLLNSLSGTPRYAAEGWADPVDAAGLVTPALPDSSANVADLDSWRTRP